jgi:hypothetical protein
MSAAAIIAAGVTCGSLALSATAAPLAPAANPFARLTADQIAKKAVADLEKASSFHFHGSGKESGQAFSISVSVTHQGCTGWIGDGSIGGFAIRAIGKTAWIQPNNKFWQFAGVPASELSAVEGKWLPISESASNSVSAGFLPFCTSNTLASAFAPQLTGLVKGKTVKISGHPALQLRNKSGRESIYVSISSKPEILRISDDGTLNFSAYGAHVTITAPPASDVIALPTPALSVPSVQHLLQGA